MNTIQQLLAAIAPVKQGDRYLIAISGGLDSIVLSHLCLKAKIPMEWAHCNFQLRGAESDRDEQFVRQLAQSWNVPLHVKRFDTIALSQAKQIAIQEAARSLRYEWFDALLSTHTALSWVLTAHHREDLAETIAMNFFRGTGLKGLMGIPAKNGSILRPLLSVSKNELALYATKNQLQFVEDSSNLKEDYTRNYFRHTLFPAIEKVYPQVIENLVANSRRLEQANELLQFAVRDFKNKYLQQKGDEFQLSIASLLPYKDTSLLFELLIPFGFSSGQINEAKELLWARTGAQLQAAGGAWKLIKHRKFLLVAPMVSQLDDYILLDDKTSTVLFPNGKIKCAFEQGNSFIKGSAFQACLDLRLLNFPLLLRRWKEGDYFYPLGMRKKKKVARLLIDHKLSATQKEKVWVLTAADKIIWVVGIQLDDRFKITPKTTEQLHLTWEPSLV